MLIYFILNVDEEEVQRGESQLSTYDWWLN